MYRYNVAYEYTQFFIRTIIPSINTRNVIFKREPLHREQNIEIFPNPNESLSYLKLYFYYCSFCIGEENNHDYRYSKKVVLKKLNYGIVLLKTKPVKKNVDQVLVTDI